MAVLLGTRSIGASLVAVGLFFAAALVVLVVPARLLRVPGLGRALVRGTSTTSQLAMRTVLLLLAALMAVASVFGLDVVLGAFAAGIILRRLVDVLAAQLRAGGETPDRGLAEVLTHQLETVGYSVFIPVFFVVSGMAISVASVAGAPWVLVAAVASMLVIRGGGVWLSETVLHPSPGLTTAGERARVGLYAATGLPIIVAVTQVAVDNGLMAADISSVLVAAGAVTVLVFPLLAELVRSRGPGMSGDGGRPIQSVGRGDDGPDHNHDDDDEVRYQ